ncbi:hypothetical protein Bhyg_09658, partial [Pseudolycoriella hygida]
MNKSALKFNFVNLEEINRNLIHSRKMASSSVFLLFEVRKLYRDRRLSHGIQEQEMLCAVTKRERVKLTSRRLQQSVLTTQNLEKLFFAMAAVTSDHISLLEFFIKVFVCDVASICILVRLRPLPVSTLLNRVQNSAKIGESKECFLAGKKFKSAKRLHSMVDRQHGEIVRPQSSSSATFAAEEDNIATNINNVSTDKGTNNISSEGRQIKPKKIIQRNFARVPNRYLSGMWYVKVNWWSELMLNGFFREKVGLDGFQLLDYRRRIVSIFSKNIQQDFDCLVGKELKRRIPIIDGACQLKFIDVVCLVNIEQFGLKFRVPQQIRLDARCREMFNGSWSSVKPVKSLDGYCQALTLFPVWIKLTISREVELSDGKMIKVTLFVTSGSNSVVVNMKLASDSAENQKIRMLSMGWYYRVQLRPYSKNHLIERGKIFKYANMTVDFWQCLRTIVPTDVPEYLRKLLSDTGFDNFVSMEAVGDSVLKELQDHAEKENTKILLGHKVLLLRIRDMIPRKANGIDLIAEEKSIRIRIKELFKKFCLEEHIHKVTHESVQLKIETDPTGAPMCLAKIYCCFCSETSTIRQYGRPKKDGTRGAERWVMSNFETHLRSNHIGRLTPSVKSMLTSTKVNHSKTSDDTSDDTPVVATLSGTHYSGGRKKFLKRKDTRSRRYRNQRRRYRSILYKQPLITESFKILNEIDKLCAVNKELTEAISHLLDDKPEIELSHSAVLNCLVRASTRQKSVKGKTGQRHETSMKDFASYIFMLGGRLCYETLYKNIPLPSPTSIARNIHDTGSQIIEWVLRTNELKKYLEDRTFPMTVWISEDGTEYKNKSEASDSTEDSTLKKCRSRKGKCESCIER